ncbi:MAG: hypothetical protein A2942_02135 [Candidatus Lloydbacteria bacterium RIFCSPLOWO2_01_FULL_50_20]|uniref:Uncharacterized protein n=1 Tax=Candidatus Lloydbacteria bacterium RIFCSPLOWO2_01_FULL_50_20 TaxID=1798665 RepID=A0A1G2DLG8_9BACT|nr:MAG: hypothetical protein A3C13_04700 [Candidatus Lloydbacteria bacterium RIFCSPHIGHO2_02_FULL_50_11]OGZ13750.1 MAG: hypothetical protein A2942_02135 [Candidatus Lloydbacteria bacterium RIFCSPLOWO2_01_FULL_50_20]
MYAQAVLGTSIFTLVAISAVAINAVKIKRGNMFLCIAQIVLFSAGWIIAFLLFSFLVSVFVVLMLHFTQEAIEWFAGTLLYPVQWLL